MANSMKNKRWYFVVMLIITVFLSLRQRNPKVDQLEDINFSVFLKKDDAIQPYSMADNHDLEYDFYRQTCPQAESIVRSRMASIYSQRNDLSAGLLRLFLHDCCVKGFDASVLLDDCNGNTNLSFEKQAIPNTTLMGLHQIDMIKEEIENACPGVVSCTDTLALLCSTREGVLLVTSGSNRTTGAVVFVLATVVYILVALCGFARAESELPDFPDLPIPVRRTPLERARDALLVEITSQNIEDAATGSPPPFIIRVLNADLGEIFTGHLQLVVEDESEFDGMMLAAWGSRHQLEDLQIMMLSLTLDNSWRHPWSANARVFYYYNSDSHEDPPTVWTTLEGVLIIEDDPAEDNM